MLSFDLMISVWYHGLKLLGFHSWGLKVDFHVLGPRWRHQAAPSVWILTAHSCLVQYPELGVYLLSCGPAAGVFGSECSVLLIRHLLITQDITLCLTVVAASCSFWAVALWITPFFSALWAIMCFHFACPKESNGMYSRGQAFLDSAATVTDAWFCLSVADVAAIACGREFLVNSSRVLLDTILQLLGDLKPGQCTKLKVYGG